MQPRERDSGPVAGAYATLSILLVVYVFNHVDRQILSILLQPIKEELGASDTALGLLAGSFAIFYTLAGIPIARWADVGVRRNIIAVALAVWSAMTAACGLVRTFPQLFLVRMGVAVGEAGCTPPAHSMLSDLFPLGRRGTALGIYTLGVPIGGLLGLAAGGWINEFIGWRLAFILVGLPGLVLALVARFAMPEPVRGGAEASTREVDPPPPLREAVAYLWRLRTLRHLLLGMSIQSFALGAAVWQPTFFMRTFELDTGLVGTALGLIMGVGSGLGVFLGGWLGDRLEHRDPRWYLWLPALGAVSCAPFAAAAYLADTAMIAFLFLLPAAVLNHVHGAVGHATAQSLARPRARALVSAMMLFLMNLGAGAGPFVVGALNDALGPALGEDHAIRYSLLLALIPFPWASVHFALAARTLRTDLAAATA